MPNTTPQNTDRIEKQIVLRAPRERVWDAISDARQFGAWFGVEFESGFVAGSSMKGKIVPTQVDPEIAKLQEPHTGMLFQIFVERIEPMRLFAFRWHPFAVDSSKDYSKEPMTLVTFELAEASGGTALTITESGFDKIPLERRAEAFTANNRGWEAQAKLIQKYLEQKSAEQR
jgi:uncharacterized protein YndB with AHSA1/START domain